MKNDFFFCILSVYGRYLKNSVDGLPIAKSIQLPVSQIRQSGFPFGIQSHKKTKIDFHDKRKI